MSIEEIDNEKPAMLANRDYAVSEVLAFTEQAYERGKRDGETAGESETGSLPEGVAFAAMPIRWSRRRDRLAAALAKAQGEIVLAEKDRTNEHLRSSYASFGQIREVGRIPLSQNGIAVVQGPHVDEQRVTVVTQLVHSSGQWVECELSFVAEYMKGLNWMQIFGVIMTYAKRYTLQALTGVAVREDDLDDDGQGLEAPVKPAERVAAPKIDMPQTYAGLLAAIDKLKTIDEARELWRMGRFMPFKMDPEQTAEAEARHKAKVEEIKSGTVPTKAQTVAAEISERTGKGKKSKADANPANVKCSACAETDVMVGGFQMDTSAVQGKDGAWVCGKCLAAMEGGA